MIDPNMFARGYCAEFALALHELYGYELVSFDEQCDDGCSCSIHYAAKAGASIIDVRGLRSAEQVIKSLWSCEKQGYIASESVTVREVTAHEIECETEIVEEAKQLALEYIQAVVTYKGD